MSLKIGNKTLQHKQHKFHAARSKESHTQAVKIVQFTPKPKTITYIAQLMIVSLNKSSGLMEHVNHAKGLKLRILTKEFVLTLL